MCEITKCVLANGYVGSKKYVRLKMKRKNKTACAAEELSMFVNLVQISRSSARYLQSEWQVGRFDLI